MTRKDFQLIAMILRLSRDGQNDTATISEIAHSFANNLGATNPRFNRETFLTACGVEL
jgi:hypothetical protein